MDENETEKEKARNMSVFQRCELSVYVAGVPKREYFKWNEDERIV